MTFRIYYKALSRPILLLTVLFHNSIFGIADQLHQVARCRTGIAATAALDAILDIMVATFVPALIFGEQGKLARHQPHRAGIHTAATADAGLVKSLRDRPGKQHVIITGRRADPRLLEVATMVTEMTKVKHPFDDGQKGQRGIEW